jgi:hypothetical protein
MIAARVCRWTAIAIALIGILDPRVPLPQRTRPAIRVLAADAASEAGLRARLADAGFGSNGAEAAVVATRDAVIGRVPDSPLFALGLDAGPDVTIRRAAASTVRVPGQAVSVFVVLRARGASGRTSELRLEDAGLAVASASHRWTRDDETWQATMTYLPASSNAIRLRVSAGVLEGERYAADNTADVLAPAERGPLRTLVFAPAVTWPVVFVRRTLESDPAFSVASLQRATKNVVTRAGGPPGALTRNDLEPYEVLLSGTLDLDAAAREAVRWFVEERGGVAVFVPDHVEPRGGSILDGLSFESRVVDAPVALTAAQGGLSASELAIPSGLPPLTEALAADPAGTPVVVAVRRGAGAVVVSGALDAWRYRDAPGFARFWPSALLAQASATPPRLEVSVSPAVVRPGDPVRVSAVLRPTEMPPAAGELVLPSVSARAVSPGAKVDAPIRLWPTPEPGRYEGEWRPPLAGEYAVDVTAGPLTGAAVMTADAAAARQPGGDDTAEIAALASGGGVFADEASLARTLAGKFPAAAASVPVRVARSPWWAVAFASLLCAEWALRRRRGLA